MTTVEIAVMALGEVLVASAETVSIVLLATWIVFVWLPVMAAAYRMRGWRNALGQAPGLRSLEGARMAGDVGLAHAGCRTMRP